MPDTKSETAEPPLAPWESSRVKLVYDILCDGELPPNPEEHWEGWTARKIVAALFPGLQMADPTSQTATDELIERAAAAYQDFNDPEDGRASHTWEELAPAIKKRRRRWMRAVLVEIGAVTNAG